MKQLTIAILIADLLVVGAILLSKRPYSPTPNLRQQPKRYTEPMRHTKTPGRQTLPPPEQQDDSGDDEEEEQQEAPETPRGIEPKWTSYQPLRQVSNLGKVLSDVEGHLKAGHIYRDSDKITWTHEGTHGINSDLRQKFSRGGNCCIAYMDNKPVFKSLEHINGFYVLNNKACIINEPQSSVTAAAHEVPRSLQGTSFNLYMVQQARSWNDSPLYIFDEFSAYTNGSDCRLDLGIQQRQESTLQMLEFGVYAMCLAKACNSDDPQFKNFLRWQLTRAMKIYRDSKVKLDNADRHDAYLEKLRSSSDADGLRQFVRGYFGSSWAKKVLGF